MQTKITLMAIVISFAACAQAREPEHAARLIELVKQDCGSCHGLTLKGGLGPALTPEAIAGTPDEVLTATILYGRPTTAMPPWQGILSREEAQWIVEKLREGL